MTPRFVVVGKIVGPFGVRGWVKVRSFTDPPENVIGYQPWELTSPQGVRSSIRVEQSRPRGEFFLVKLNGYENRELAADLRGFEISVSREVMPRLPEGEYYRVDLIGMRVVTLDGFELGEIKDFIETGANDVMVIEGPGSHLVPFAVGHYVMKVEFDKNLVTVDWQLDY